MSISLANSAGIFSAIFSFHVRLFSTAISFAS
jgi:hypothetical protein